MTIKRRKKEARIARKRAKNRQKMETSLQTTTKYKTLEAKVRKGFKRQGLSSNDVVLIDPPDGVKMSAVILKLAKPLLKKYGDRDEIIETIITLTIIEWNRLMLPENEQENLQNEMIDQLPGDKAETVGPLLYISELIAKRKKKYFPDLKKGIINYELIISNGDITLNIASTQITSSAGC